MFQKKKQILVVDDSYINRTLLKKILSDQYNVVLAENGQAALDILLKNSDETTAVFLDLNMPVMNGLEFLKIVRRTQALSAIPIVVMTQSNDVDTEILALEYGATDFISKPYSPTIIRQKLVNMLALNEAAALKNTTERDSLTGLFNKITFCSKAEEWIHSESTMLFDIVCIDIERFKLINDLFGVQEGDKLLVYLASCIQSSFSTAASIHARLSGDNFAICCPHIEASGEVVKTIMDKLEKYSLPIRIVIKVGIYMINDRTIPVSVMCDRANLAIEKIKGKYQFLYAYYDVALRQNLLEEQEITNEMHRALQSGQFEVYYQPKYNLTTRKIVGAEALVRWIHPTKGIMQPLKFISIFEKNGFITNLDEYVWESACRWIRQWIDAGNQPIPISINVSRVDIYNPKICEILEGLVQKYSLSHHLLELEITETAYTENASQLIDVTKRLKELGFVIEMDDFGAGYSSLNMLNEVPVDVIKLDMRFLSDSNKNRQGGNILNFVVSMAKWMKLVVISEGVETEEQVAFLRGIGCNFGQGYYFAHPMLRYELEQLLHNHEIDVIETSRPDFISWIDEKEFWNPNSNFNLLFNNFVCALALYEWQNGKLLLLRANDKYYEVLNTTRQEIYNASSQLLNYIHQDDRVSFINMLEESKDTLQEQMSDSRWFSPGSKDLNWLRTRMKVVMSSLDHTIFLGAIEDITLQKQTEFKLRMSEQRLRIAVAQADINMWEYNIQTHTIFFSDIGEFKMDMPSVMENAPFSLIEQKYIHEDSVAKCLEIYEKLDKGEPFVEGIVKHYKQNGEWIWIKISYSTIFDAENHPISAIGVGRNVTQEVEANQRYERELQLRSALIKDAISYLELDVNEDKLLGCSCDLMNFIQNKKLVKMQAVIREIAEDFIFAEDRMFFINILTIPSLKKEYNEGTTQSYYEMRYRRKIEDEYRWLGMTMNLMKNPNDGHLNLFVYAIDIHEKKLQNIKMCRESQRDSLTGLLNRSAFENYVNKRLEESQRTKGLSAFMMLDIDNFKQINDSRGHRCGDHVLELVSNAIKKIFRINDVVGRLGGDEFVIFLPCVQSDQYAIAKGNKVCRLLRGLKIKEYGLVLTCSVGISVAPVHGKTFDELYQKADLALYHAKSLGKDRCCLYQSCER